MVSVLRTSDLGLFLRESQVSTSGSWPILGYTELALFLRGSCDPHIASWIRNGIMISMCELRLKLRSKMGPLETSDRRSGNVPMVVLGVEHFLR